MSYDGKRKPLFIGMPVYNGGKFLRGAIETLLDQTFEDFTILISDNCSSDNTQVICEEFSSKDSRILYHRHERNRVHRKF